MDRLRLLNCHDYFSMACCCFFEENKLIPLKLGSILSHMKCNFLRYPQAKDSLVYYDFANTFPKTVSVLESNGTDKHIALSVCTEKGEQPLTGVEFIKILESSNKDSGTDVWVTNETILSSIVGSCIVHIEYTNGLSIIKTCFIP